MKTRHIVMAALLASVWLAFFSEPTTPTEIAEPISRTNSQADISPEKTSSLNAVPATPSRQNDEAAIQALQPRETLIKRSQGGTAAGTLFGSHDWTPAPAVTAFTPSPPPSAPPLPFKYLGKSKETDQWQVFLSKDEITLIVKENDVIDSLYRVQSIAPPAMTLLYLPLSETQSLTIE